jgi:hypothetical protein
MIFTLILSFKVIIVGLVVIKAGMPSLGSGIYADSSLVYYLDYLEGFDCCTLLSWSSSCRSSRHSVIAVDSTRLDYPSRIVIEKIVRLVSGSLVALHLHLR